MHIEEKSTVLDRTLSDEIITKNASFLVAARNYLPHWIPDDKFVDSLESFLRSLQLHPASASPFPALSPRIIGALCAILSHLTNLPHPCPQSVALHCRKWTTEVAICLFGAVSSHSFSFCKGPQSNPVNLPTCSTFRLMTNALPCDLLARVAVHLAVPLLRPRPESSECALHRIVFLRYLCLAKPCVFAALVCMRMCPVFTLMFRNARLRACYCGPCASGFPSNSPGDTERAGRAVAMERMLSGQCGRGRDGCTMYFVSSVIACVEECKVSFERLSSPAGSSVRNSAGDCRSGAVDLSHDLFDVAVVAAEAVLANAEDHPLLMRGASHCGSELASVFEALLPAAPPSAVSQDIISFLSGAKECSESNQPQAYSQEVGCILVASPLIRSGIAASFSRRASCVNARMHDLWLQFWCLRHLFLLTDMQSWISDVYTLAPLYCSKPGEVSSTAWRADNRYSRVACAVHVLAGLCYPSIWHRAVHLCGVHSKVTLSAEAGMWFATLLAHRVLSICFRLLQRRAALNDPLSLNRTDSCSIVQCSGCLCDMDPAQTQARGAPSAQQPAVILCSVCVSTISALPVVGLFAMLQIFAYAPVCVSTWEFGATSKQSDDGVPPLLSDIVVALLPHLSCNSWRSLLMLISARSLAVADNQSLQNSSAHLQRVLQSSVPSVGCTCSQALCYGRCNYND